LLLLLLLLSLLLLLLLLKEIELAWMNLSLDGGEYFTQELMLCTDAISLRIFFYMA
jgi:hypothetical protein